MATVTEVSKSESSSPPGRTPAESFIIPAVRLDEKGIPVYAARIKAGDLLDVFDVKRFSAEELDWYQRKRFDQKAFEMKEYLVDCPIAIVPSVLLGVPEKVRFTPTRGSDDLGSIEIHRRLGALRMIDGQHRIAGFDVARDELRALERLAKGSGLSNEDRERLDRLRRLMEYEVPVAIVDSTVAVDVAEKKRAKHFDSKQLTTLNAERVIFFILNKTQKGLNPSLKDQLAYRIWFSGIRGIPAIEEQEWRAYATRIVEELKRPGSPLEGHIVDATFASMGRRVRLSSFVTSLQWLFGEPTFFSKNTEKLTEEARNEQHAKELDYIRTFWTVVRELFPEAFRDSGGHLLLRTLSVYAMNRLAADVFTWIGEVGKTPSKGEIESHLVRLKGFDWSRERSPVRAFGGQQGATEAYRLLLRQLAAGGDTRAAARLKALPE
jgi:hypothetical protein